MQAKDCRGIFGARRGRHHPLSEVHFYPIGVERCKRLLVSRFARAALAKWARRCREPDLARRIRIVLDWLKGYPITHIARVLGCHRSTVHRVLDRFSEYGATGLVDRREDNGDAKVDDEFLATLAEAVGRTPQDYGWKRPRWTLELLIATLYNRERLRVSPATMSRALRRIGAHRGRPRPVVGCPWSRAAVRRRMIQIQWQLDNFPPGDVVVFEDEVDIHLNPKIGPDWMLKGQQKAVMTPGQNQKTYLAGAQHCRTRKIAWVRGLRKNSSLFIALLVQLLLAYPHARRIHVVLDNFKIHDSRQTRQWLKDHGANIVLQFLPPYYPQGNPIERTWGDLHEQVTRNHRCRNLEELMSRVHDYLVRRNRMATQRQKNVA